MNKEELGKLITYIEENTRADKVSGIEFIDPRNFKSRVIGKQNYVVFGRRGAGKSTLLKTIENNDKITTVYVNLEDYKDITFPNIIIKILSAFYSNLIQSLQENTSLKRPIHFLKTKKLVKKIKSLIKDLESKLVAPDSYEERKKKILKQEDGVTGEIKYKGAGLGTSSKEHFEQEFEHSWEVDKLNELKTSIDVNKKIIQEIIDFSKKQIILIFDDFYFIPKKTQPFLVDYFHRLTKSNDFYLKIGTIKHRSHLYFQSDQSYIGMEMNADVYDIDLDYTLDKWNDLKNFKKDLLNEAIRASGAQIEILDIFNEQSFNQLCIASGGVPRDFLVLFIKCCQLLNDTKLKITVPDVRETAIQNYVNKKSALEKDSLDDSNILESYINYLRDTVFTTKRTNVFLIENESLNREESVRQILRELIDLRFLHVIDNNTSAAPSDGKRYSAYLLDVSLYDNGRPREFKEVVPDIKSNRDDVRGAYRVSVAKLKELNEKINENVC